jgi:hypothetical protein
VSFLCASYGIKHPGCGFGMSVFSNRCVNLCFSAQSRRGCETANQLARKAFDCARSIDPSLSLPWAGMSADFPAR